MNQNSSSKQNTEKRSVGAVLGICIFLMPLIFSWFTLRKGHSNKAKILSFLWLFAWLFACVVLAISSQNDSNTTIPTTNPSATTKPLAKKIVASPVSILLELSLDHEISNGKVYIKGKSNLPKGMKLGITLSNSEISYSAQDYSIIVNKNGEFKSDGFSYHGKQLQGIYKAELISYFNNNWQNSNILSQLKGYHGKEIINGEKIETNYTINIEPISSQKNNLFKKKTKYAELTQKFCYALQASMLCDNLKMRIDTEGKITAEVGTKIRGPGSIYNNDCMDGLNQALEEENMGLCTNAWKRYGCFGNDIPKLIQENRFRNRNAVLCEY